MVGVAVGIDLGTTYSSVGVFEDGKVEVIANEQGHRKIPSCVAFNDTECLIGHDALDQNPENTIFNIKRLIGHKYDEDTVLADIRRWPFQVVRCRKKLYNVPKLRVHYKGERKEFFPEEISSMILTKLKQMAENYLSATVTDAVISVPAFFNDSQRQATKEAGRIAGLNVLRIINEPTAAAIAYGLNKESESDGEKNVLVCDLGGGTFDVSILGVEDGIFEVKATDGNTHLGGEDFDNCLVNHFVQEFKFKNMQDISDDERALHTLRIACEKVKRDLSISSETSIEINLHGVDFHSTINKVTFEELCSDLFVDILKSVEVVLADAHLQKNEIHAILLVGGSIQIPKIKEMLKDHFNGKDHVKFVNAEDAVVRGSAIQAAILKGVENELIQDLLVLDVVSRTLLIETDGVTKTLFQRNTTIPATRTHTVTTNANNQPSVSIQVYENDCRANVVCRFELLGISPAPLGEPQIDVTFDIDDNGILNVSTAKSRNTGKAEKITIKS